jgi:transposase
MATDGATQLTSPDDELTRLRQENEWLRAAHQPLRQEVERLRAEDRQRQSKIEFLQTLHGELLEQQQRKDRLIDGLQHQLQQLLKRLYGRSAEKLDKNQMLLFETLLSQLAPETPADAAANSDAAPGATSDASSPDSDAGPSKTNGRGHGRRRLPAGLEREKIIHDLAEDQKPCPCCGKLRHVIGQAISEQLEYVPAHLKVLQHARLKYACRNCEQSAAETGAQVTTAEKPLSPIDKGLAGPGLLAYLIVGKYGDHLPLYRLERILERHGLEIARSTMCDWMASCAALLRPLSDRMKTHILQSKVIHTDDTPVEVLEPGRGQTRTGRFWVYLGDGDHPFTVFAYTPNRSRDGPVQFLKDWGKDQRVYLQADAFAATNTAARRRPVTEVAVGPCRKFYEASSRYESSTQAPRHPAAHDVEIGRSRSSRGSAGVPLATWKATATAEHRRPSSTGTRRSALPRPEQFKEG